MQKVVFAVFFKKLNDLYQFLHEYYMREKIDHFVEICSFFVYNMLHYIK